MPKYKVLFCLSITLFYSCQAVCLTFGLWLCSVDANPHLLIQSCKNMPITHKKIWDTTQKICSQLNVELAEVVVGGRVWEEN